MKRRYILTAAGLAALLLAFLFLVPQRVIKGNTRLYAVEWNGADVTETLSTEQRAALEALALDAQCARWQNPMGSFFLREDTVVLSLISDTMDGPCRFYLVGGMDRYAVTRNGKDYNLRDGETMLNAVLDVLKGGQ